MDPAIGICIDAAFAKDAFLKEHQVVRMHIVLAGIIVLLTTPVAQAVLIGFFPGLDELIEKSDAIVILRIEKSHGDFGRSTLYSTHDCFIYQTLKGDIPPKSRMPLQLMDTRTAFVNPFAYNSTHLMFLTRKRSRNEPTEYRTIAYRGANVRLSPFGHERKPKGSTLKEQIVGILKATAEYDRKQHEKQQAFLDRMITDKPEPIDTVPD
jgi:hypothetical protein